MQIEVGALFICVGLMILVEIAHAKGIAYVKRVEVKTVRFIEWAAFVGTVVVYLAFIGGLYMNDLWGFATWLQVNLSEAYALLVFAVLGVILPLVMSYVKSIIYRYLAR